MIMEVAYSECDLLYDSTVGEVVVDGRPAWNNYLTICNEYETTSKIEEDDERLLRSRESLDSDESYRQICHSNGLATEYGGKNKFRSVVDLQPKLAVSAVDPADVGSRVERRIIVVQAGDDPERETTLAIAKITEELNQKAAAAMSAGIMPDAETVIEITTVMESAAASQPMQKHSTLKSDGHCNTFRENMPSDFAEKHSAVTFRNHEYQTPSPLVSAAVPSLMAGVEPLSSVLEQDCEDFYFRPSTSDSLSSVNLETGDTSQRGNPVLSSDFKTGLSQMLHGQHLDKQTANDHSNSLCKSTRSSSRDQPAIQLIGGTFVRSAAQTKHESVHLKRPPYSYMQLIQMAIASSPQKRMTLREIYQWIEASFVYYKRLPNQGWKNSVRHNLSLYDLFVRKKASTGKASCSYWMMRQADDASCDSSIGSGSDDMTPPNEELPRELPQRSRNCQKTEFVQSSQSESKSRQTESQKFQKKGLVPLLPKPSPSVQTITLVHVPSVSSDNPSVRLSKTAVQTDRALTCTNLSANFVDQSASIVNRNLLTKRCSNTDLGSTSVPYKIKLLRSSVSDPGEEVVYDFAKQPANSVAETNGSLLSSSLDTSSLRQQLSDMQFETAASAKYSSRVKSASDIVLLKSSSLPEPRNSEPVRTKLEPSRQNRRKQQFDQLLRTPPDKLVNKKITARHFRPTEDLTRVSDSESQNIGNMESEYSTMLDSGFASLMEVSTRPVTPPNQVWRRSPVHEPTNEDDDVLQMLFTPFKADFAGVGLADLSPVLGLSMSSSADRDLWGEFTPMSEKTSARTSTPRRPLNSTPKNLSRSGSGTWDRLHKCDLSPGFYRLLSELDDDELSAGTRSNKDFLSPNGNSMLEKCIRFGASEMDF